jgi:hypothetical protein
MYFLFPILSLPILTTQKEVILPDEIYKVISKFKEAGFQIYIVGGVVRDILIKRPSKDWDFTTDAKPEEILALFPEGVYGNSFGTVVIPKKGTTYDRDRGQSAFDITTMRKEGWCFGSKQLIAFWAFWRKALSIAGISKHNRSCSCLVGLSEGANLNPSVHSDSMLYLSTQTCAGVIVQSL